MRTRIDDVELEWFNDEGVDTLFPTPKYAVAFSGKVAIHVQGVSYVGLLVVKRGAPFGDRTHNLRTTCQYCM